MSVIRTLFLGTPEFARFHLQHLLGDEHFNVVGVVSQPDRPRGRKLELSPSPVKQLALEKSIPVFTPEKASDPGFIEQIKKLTAEVAIVVAYGQILKPSFLSLYPSKVVNVHGSVLPQLRGAAPIQRAIMNGDSETGVSLQIMVDKLDAGPVIGIRKLKISKNMNAQELHNAMMPLGADLLHVELMDYIRGHLTAVPQDESKVTIAPKIRPEEEKIDWANSTAIQIHNLVRGLALQGGAFTLLETKRFKVHSTEIADKTNLQPGQAIVENNRLFIGCKSGAIEALIVQPEGKPRMKTSEFLKGFGSKPFAL